MAYKKSEFGVVQNHVETYAQAVADLIEHGSIVLNWTDSRGSLFNVLLSFMPPRYGAQGGIVDGAPGKLWVGLAGRGCYAWSVGGGVLAADYVSEKLGIALGSAAPLSELVSHIRIGLQLVQSGQSYGL